MDAKILLPVRPHIKKYLEIQHGKTLVVSLRGYIPHLVYLMLEKCEKQDPAKVRPSQKMIDGRNYLGYVVYVGSTPFKDRGAYISKKNIERFNDNIDDMMKEEMVRCIHYPTASKFEVDSAIIYFRDFYGITEDELPFENLKRWYYRNRQRLIARKTFIPETEPQLILTF